MRDYLLFIDTEASGLPKKWDVPYSTENNWPYAVQISWVIVTKEGEPVKKENHYVSDHDFDITPASFQIHGITRAFLTQNGEKRKDILSMLSADLHQYEPLIVGHFVELDKHITGADYYRSGMKSPIDQLPSFCTMLATTSMVRNPRHKYLRLGDLYTTLFDEELQHQHNALVDATATAACFFELLKRGDITDKKIEQQQADAKNAPRNTQTAGWTVVLLAIGLITALLVHWL